MNNLKISIVSFPFALVLAVGLLVGIEYLYGASVAGVTHPAKTGALLDLAVTVGAYMAVSASLEHLSAEYRCVAFLVNALYRFIRFAIHTLFVLFILYIAFRVGMYIEESRLKPLSGTAAAIAGCILGGIYAGPFRDLVDKLLPP